MKLPVFSIKSGFVDDIDPKMVTTDTDDPIFVYDTKDPEEIEVLVSPNERDIAYAIGSMARLMGIPCVIESAYVKIPVNSETTTYMLKVTVKLPFRLRREVIEKEMVMKSYDNSTITVGFNGMERLVEALASGK